MKDPWQQRALLFAAITVFAFSIFFISKSQRLKAHPLDPSGGEYFTNFTTIDTPLYLQTDNRWADDTIGGSHEKLSTAGCTVCCLAMAVSALGIETTPQQLNTYLKENDGYNFRGWLKWSAVKDFTDGRVEVDHAAPLKHTSIDDALKAGNPVMLKLLIQNNTVQHWVLVVGKEGTDYLIRDPLGGDQSYDRLSQYGSRVFAIRVIRSSAKR